MTAGHALRRILPPLSPPLRLLVLLRGNGAARSCASSTTASGGAAAGISGGRAGAPAGGGGGAGGEGTASATGEGGDAVALVGARIYRRTRPEHHRVFKWGVGNRWRMQSANRFTPVHKPHPKEVVVRDDYYESDNPNIVWENLNEAWEVYWYENKKLNAKPFPVKKYGVERSKREAAAFYEELSLAGRLGEKLKVEKPEAGVFYDARMSSWVSLFWRDGRPQTRCYSATKYGFDGSKALAVAKRQDPVNGVLPVRPGGGTASRLKRPGQAHAARRA